MYSIGRLGKLNKIKSKSNQRQLLNNNSYFEAISGSTIEVGGNTSLVETTQVITLCSMTQWYDKKSRLVRSGL